MNTADRQRRVPLAKRETAFAVTQARRAIRVRNVAFPEDLTAVGWPGGSLRKNPRCRLGQGYQPKRGKAGKKRSKITVLLLSRVGFSARRKPHRPSPRVIPDTSQAELLVHPADPRP